MITRIPTFRKFIGTRTVAQILEVSQSTVRRLAGSVIPCYQHGSSGDLKFYEDDILEYMERVQKGELPKVGNPSWFSLQDRSIAA